MSFLSSRFMDGVSLLCMYRLITTFPKSDFLRSLDVIPNSPCIKLMAWTIRWRIVTFPRVPFFNGWIHRLQTARISRSSNIRNISLRPITSTTSVISISFFSAGRFCAMASSSKLAACSILSMRALPSSSSSLNFLAWRFLRFILLTACMIGLSGSPSASSSARSDRPRSEPTPRIFFLTCRSSMASPRSSNCWSAYSSLMASWSSPSVSMKSLSSLVRTYSAESKELAES
mmetsp:Transcript_1518/g.3760  ORF Transcript_1518/g.3760 Transcript_1518/m.3760 type:complete len:231 (-) Transcript_1518:456-1148(-)